MDVREHKGFSHGLPPGTTEDINCGSCQYEKAKGITPTITEGPPLGFAAARRRAAEALAVEFGDNVDEWRV